MPRGRVPLSFPKGLDRAGPAAVDLRAAATGRERAWALENGISQVVFDRGGYRYHGRVKALAEAARKAGLEL